MSEDGAASAVQRPVVKTNTLMIETGHFWYRKPKPY
jgi:hypothetical protein